MEPLLVFPATAYNQDRSNFGLWTAEGVIYYCLERSQKNPFMEFPPTPISSKPTSRRTSDSSSKIALFQDSQYDVSPSEQNALVEPSRRIRYHGRRFAHPTNLKKESWEEYRRLHESRPPAVQKQLHDSGIREYTLHHDEDADHLVASFRYIGYGFRDDLQRMRENSKMMEWFQKTRGMSENGSESAELLWWAQVEGANF